MWGEHRTGEELKEKMEDDGGWDGLEDDFCFELDDDGRIANTAEHVDCSTAVSTIACLDGGAKEPEAEAASTLLRDLRTDCALADCGLVKDTFWLSAEQCCAGEPSSEDATTAPVAAGERR